MRISRLLPLALALVVTAGSFAAAMGPMHTKILPYSIDYPLISPTRFPAEPNRDYKATFNVRRMFKSPADYKDTLVATMDWFGAYGGYGVMGHGVDVFTRRAALWRMRHRGR